MDFQNGMFIKIGDDFLIRFRSLLDVKSVHRELVEFFLEKKNQLNRSQHFIHQLQLLFFTSFMHVCDSFKLLYFHCVLSTINIFFHA